MELNDWLEREAGLSGRRLEVAIKQCSDGMIEQVSDLIHLWKGGELESIFPAFIKGAVSTISLQSNPRRTYFCNQVVIALKREEKNATTTNDQPRSTKAKPAENAHGETNGNEDASDPKPKQQPDTAQLNATLPPSKKFHYFA